ncbi:MAG: DNA repair exonuclease [Candidatus Pacearchaeota archaeon]
MKFAHIADVHLGAWRYPELQELNAQAFRQVIDTCIQEQVNFIVLSGDLFDVAMPPIDVLKEAVSEFKKLKDAGIPCYLVPGSHDFSVTGKTFIDVLERGGFCKNVASLREENGFFFLNFFRDDKNNAVFAGIPGKKASLELEFFERLKADLGEYKDMLKILIFHTTLSECKPFESMPSITASELPSGFDYYAAGHIHIAEVIKKDKQDNVFVVYPGPVFPNNLEELEQFSCGSFYIVTYDNKKFEVQKKELKFKEVISSLIDVDGLSSQQANIKILEELSKLDLKDKIFILRVSGCLSSGKTSDIDIEKIREKTKESYLLLKSFSKLTTKELKVEVKGEHKTIDEIENEFIMEYEKQIPNEFINFSKFIVPLLEHLNFEKQEGEKKEDFQARVFENVSKILNLKSTLEK